MSDFPRLLSPLCWKKDLGTENRETRLRTVAVVECSIPDDLRLRQVRASRLIILLLLIRVMPTWPYRAVGPTIPVAGLVLGGHDGTASDNR
jgi:hypothetical protein